jgi:molybdenum cofactor biosynthesis enzyme MoaA
MRVKSPLRVINNIFLRRSLIEAQIIVTRRCNLSCGYCTEYDNVSKSIPFPLLRERIDALHRLGVTQIAMLGGEPLMHEEIHNVIEHASRESQVSMTTNGFLVSKDVVHRLNDSGLQHMQVSIDTLKPTDDLYIQKSMKTIQKKLEMLLEHAHFSVHSNIVLCEASKPDFKEMVAGLRKLNIPVTVNLLHNDRGAVSISCQDYLELWEHHHRESRVISHIEYDYGKALLNGESRKWRCRAGSRHLYVDEFGNAQFCASQRGRLNKPIVDYTMDDIREHAKTTKGCEDGCAIFCVYRASQLDNDPIGVAKAVVRSVRDQTISIPFLKRNGGNRSGRTALEHAGGTKRP